MPDTTPNLGLPFPEDGDPTDVAGDFERLATRLDSGLMIDADDPNLPTFTSTGPPLHFYGVGRPDTGYQIELSGAPIGSTFTCTSNDPNNLGAHLWQMAGLKGHTSPWECIEGYLPLPLVVNTINFGNVPWTGGGSTADARATVSIEGSIMPREAYYRLNVTFENGPGGGQPQYLMLPPSHVFSGLYGHWPTVIVGQNLGTANGPLPQTTLSSPTGGGRYALYASGRVSIQGNFVVGGAEGTTAFGLQFMHHRVWPTVIPAPAAGYGASYKDALVDQINEIESDENHPDQHLLDELRENLAELEGQKGEGDGTP